MIGMEVDVETARKLREMGAVELLEAIRAQDDALCMGMTFYRAFLPSQWTRRACLNTTLSP